MARRKQPKRFEYTARKYINEEEKMLKASPSIGKSPQQMDKLQIEYLQKQLGIYLTILLLRLTTN